MLDDVSIVGIAETEKRRPKAGEGEEGLTLDEYFFRAAAETLEDAGVGKDEVDGVGVITPQSAVPMIHPPMLVEQLGFESISWLNSVDHGGGSANALLVQSALAVQSGVADVVLCLGADTPIDPAEGFQSGGARDAPTADGDFTDPFGTQGPNSKIAHVQNVHMAEYGTELEQLAEVAVTQREHATRNPLAYFDEPIDVEDYLGAPMIADPIRLLDCVIPVNGAYGFLLASEERAAELDVDPVGIVGFGGCHNFDVVQRPDMTTTGISAASEGAFEMADVDPAETSFVQPYDDYPIIVLMQLEDMGFCAKGEGGAFVEATDLHYDGDLPVNTSGGQLSAGQAGLAGGFTQLIEGIRQLRGGGGDRQVPDADWGIVTGVGGIAYGKNLQVNNVVVLAEGGAA